MEPGKGPVSLAEWLIISGITALLGFCSKTLLLGALRLSAVHVFALARNEQFERFRKQGAGNITWFPANRDGIIAPRGTEGRYGSFRDGEPDRQMKKMSIATSQ